MLLHYDDLKADLEGEMRALADRLGVAVPDETWPELVAAAGFEQMKGNADRLVPDSTHGIWRDNQRFFHQGQSGQWRELLDDDDLRRYAARVAELAPPDLAEWAHHGPLTAMSAVRRSGQDAEHPHRAVGVGRRPKVNFRVNQQSVVHV